MNIDINEGHFILIAALLYNERGGCASSEEEIRTDMLKAVETVRKVPTKNSIIKPAAE